MRPRGSDHGDRSTCVRLHEPGQRENNSANAVRYEDIPVQVTAVLTPGQPDWRWRIINNAGEIVEESHEGRPDMAGAIAEAGRGLRR